MATIVNARDVILQETDPRSAPYTLPPEITIPAGQVEGLGDLATQDEVGVAQFAAGIEPVGLASALPDPVGYSGPAVVLLISGPDAGRMYRYVGGGWTDAVPATSITGQLTDEQLYAISAAKLTGQITGTQITDGSVTTAKLAAASITANELAVGSVTAGAMAVGSVTANAIVAQAITAGKLAVNAVTAQNIAALAVTAGKIAAGAVTATEIAANAITADKILANSVTADKIDSRGLTIRDAAGNIILGAGNALDYGNVQNGPPANATAGATWGVDVIGADAVNFNISEAAKNAIWSSVTGLGRPADFATVGAIMGSNLYDAQGNPLNSGQVLNNIVDASWWHVGVAPSSKWLENSGSNAFYDFATGPSGNPETVWHTTSTGVGAGGGWEVGPVGSSNWFHIDVTKTYRFCVPVCKYDVGGSSYWGTATNTVCDLNTTTPNANPYFAAAALGDQKWYLFVGYVFPAGSVTNTHAGAGVYDMTTGALIVAGSNFTWAVDTVMGGTRCYQYYTPTAGYRQLIARPRVELCDGSEVPLAALLASGSVSARNPITPGTASTYIANAAIGTAHIANAAIGNAQIGGDIWSANWAYNSSGWYLQRSGALYCSAGYFRGDISAANGDFRGQITGGAYTGYAWPAAYNYGFYLGPNGLLLGNANNGTYFQVEASGNIYAPGLTIINGNATFSGRVTAMDGVFVNTLNVAGNAITVGVAAAGSNAAAVAIVPQGGRVVVNVVASGYSLAAQEGLVYFQVWRNGALLAFEQFPIYASTFTGELETKSGFTSSFYVDAPPVGVYTVYTVQVIYGTGALVPAARCTTKIYVEEVKR